MTGINTKKLYSIIEEKEDLNNAPINYDWNIAAVNGQFDGSLEESKSYFVYGLELFDFSIRFNDSVLNS